MLSWELRLPYEFLYEGRKWQYYVVLGYAIDNNVLNFLTNQYITSRKPASKLIYWSIWCKQFGYGSRYIQWDWSYLFLNSGEINTSLLTIYHPNPERVETVVEWLYVFD